RAVPTPRRGTLRAARPPARGDRRRNGHHSPHIPARQDRNRPMSQATIEAPEGTQTIRITREFDATPAAVYRAHIDPELFVQWNGPDATSTQIRSWEARTGGHWSYLSHVGRESVGFYGSFHELREAERIVQTFTFEGYPDGVMLEIMTIVDL